MIPPFNDVGYLPSGLHQATLDEIQARFGSETELRQVQMESIRWMIELAVKAGAQRIVLNGSFVTDIIEPNDVDCVLLFAPGKYANPAALVELKRGLPFLEIVIVRQRQFDRLVNGLFASDRSGAPKGMVEVVL